MHLDDASDGRLDPFRGLTDAEARAATDARLGCFVVEGVRTLEVATEQDVARRIGVAKEGAFVAGQRGTGHAEDGGRHKGLRFARNPPPRKGRGALSPAVFTAYLTMQSTPSALSESHNCRAALLLPVTAWIR